MKSYFFSLFTPGRQTAHLVYSHATEGDAIVHGIELMRNRDAASLCTIDRADTFGALTYLTAIKRQQLTDQGIRHDT